MHAPKSASLITVCVSLLGANLLGAQHYPNHLEDTWEATLSGAVVLLSSKLRVDGEASQGTNINVEDILGLDKNKVQPRVALAWRPWRRHRFEVGYQWVRRSAEKTLEQQFVFRDSTYHVGELVKTNFDSDQLFFTYRFAIMASDRSEAGIGVGLGALFMNVNLDVLATGGGGGTVGVARGRSLTAPTGSLGAYGKWRVGSRSYIDADLRAIKVNTKWFDATIWEGNGGYRYFFTEKFGGELGYGISSFELTVKKTRASGGDIDTFVRYTLQNLRLGIVTAL